MIRRTSIAAIILLLALLPTATARADLLLAENAQAKLPIVLSPGATDATRTLAAELAGYLKQITGAAFEVTTAPANTTPNTGILLGSLEQFPDPALAEGLAMRGRFDGLEAFAIRTEPARLRLIANSDLGLSHAVFAFLESIGCRWFFPAKEWEVIPSIPRLTIDLNKTDRPAILSRRIWYGYGPFQDPLHPGKAQADYLAWARRNRMASSLSIRAGHAWQSVIAANKKTFEEHPEYLALTKGKRQGEQLCVSNPAVRKLVADYVLAQFDKDSKLMMASVETSDGGGHCECEGCRKIGNGSVSDAVFDLANHVAREVNKKFPGKMVGLLAYNEHCEPPSFDLEPNVYVQLTAGFITGRYTFLELADLWPKRCKNLGFYEYFSVWLWDFDMLPGGRAGDIGYIQEAITRYAKCGATSLDCESGNNWGPHGRGDYLANKLMWNPRAEVETILADFYDKAFGPGASAMRRYYDRVAIFARPSTGPVPAAAPAPGARPIDQSIFSRHVMALALRDIEDATNAAKDRPDVLARLDQLKGYLRYVHLCWQRDREPEKEKKKPLAMEIIRHVYRTRYAYMNHWNALRSEYIPKTAKDFSEPSWEVPRDKKAPPPPWKDESPVTAAENARWFAEALAYFQPQAVEHRAFSWDLIPAPKGDVASAPVTHHYQGPARYAFWSSAGEPIDVHLTTGTIAWYRNRADARWSLVDPAGKEVASGRMKQDGEAYPVSMKVPAPGLYWFEFTDQGAGWKITLPPRLGAVLVPRMDRKYAHLGHMPRAYFFVPPGTKAIHYFWAGPPHEIVGPDGKVVSKVTTTGEFVSIPVPAGMDGQPWSLSKSVPGHLWFFNCPNVLAPTPHAFLLPRE